MAMDLCSETTNLISLGVLTHERLVIAGQRRSIVVDVQHPDVHRHSAYLPRVVWETHKKKGGHHHNHVNNSFLSACVAQNMCATLAPSPGKLII